MFPLGHRSFTIMTGIIHYFIFLPALHPSFHWYFYTRQSHQNNVGSTRQPLHIVPPFAAFAVYLAGA